MTAGAVVVLDIAAFPTELVERRQWVAWRWAERPGGPTKEPINPATGRPASTKEPATWATLGAALSRAERERLAGVGFVFSADDPYAGVDLDDCRDPETGELESDAARLIQSLDSYSEVSPSGTGVKVWVRATHPGEGYKSPHIWESGTVGEIEMYDRSRFFTLTGQRLDGTPATINERQSQYDTLHRAHVSKARRRGGQGQTATAAVEAPVTKSTPTASMTDADVIATAMQAKNGQRFAALWRGDTSEYDGDDSRADAALCALLAFYTRNAGQIDRLVRQSGLYREKWERADYREMTIGGALKLVTEQCDPGLSPIVFNTDAPTVTTETPWPDPLGSAAYHGLAGEIVRAIEPETEADPVALLLTFLAAVGNIVGAGPHWSVGMTRHGLRVWPVFVGETSKARKGTSWGTINAIFRLSYPDWLKGQVASGLSSGEGLIHVVRDEMRKTEPIKEKGRIVGYEEVVVDPGVDDKRAFVVEQEYASVLRVMTRDSNTLSSVIRQAWDGGVIRTLTRNAPIMATDAHITIVGHVTRLELLRYLSDTEAGNGFGNRFLWACVRRARVLPDGGRPDHHLLDYLAGQLTNVVETSAHIGEIVRDDDARDLWHEVYGPLSEGGVGLLGAMTSRAEAQVMRLAAIYAVLDETAMMTPEHLRAGLEVWRYLEQSAAYIFGDALGDPVADAILRALRNAGEMTQTEISNLLGRNQSAARIDQALGLLATSGKVSRATRGTGGRPSIVWAAR